MKNINTTNIGKKCLVTGSTGYLGSALSETLAGRGCIVHALDVRPGVSAKPWKKEFIGDIRDYQAVRSAVEGCATVFHCAAVLNFLGVCRRTVRDEVYGINVEGTRNVIDACCDAGVKALVYTSSHTVCFDMGPIIDGDESQPYGTRFIDLYAKTKTEAERLVLAANGRKGLHTNALRPGGIWGPGHGNYMFSRFISELAKGRMVVTIGDSSAIIDNTHINNLIQAELLSAEKLIEAPARVGGQAYFITDEEPMNQMEWFRPLIEGLGYPFPKKSIPAQPLYWLAFLAECLHFAGGPRPFMTRLEVHNCTAKFTFRSDKARRDLGYNPTIKSSEGMKQCIDFYKEFALKTE